MRGKRAAPETIEAALADFQSSGLSARTFCLQRGLNYHTFLGWRERHNRLATAQSPSVITFAPAAPSGSSTEYRIQFPNGAQLRIPVQGVSLELLIAALRGDA